jgi:hypothetical protein
MIVHNTHADKIADVVTNFATMSTRLVPDWQINVHSFQAIQRPPHTPAVASSRAAAHPIPHRQNMVIRIFGINVRLAITGRGEAVNQGRFPHFTAPCQPATIPMFAAIENIGNDIPDLDSF